MNASKQNFQLSILDESLIKTLSLLYCFHYNILLEAIQSWNKQVTKFY